VIARDAVVPTDTLNRFFVSPVNGVDHVVLWKARDDA